MSDAKAAAAEALTEERDLAVNPPVDDGKREQRRPVRPNLLRPLDVEARKEELSRIEMMTSPYAPDHVKASVNRTEAMRQERALKRELESYTPKPYKGNELDRAVRREQALREEITGAMLTQEEMRRNPPGAVDRHRAFEQEYKSKIGEWKNIRLRLQESGQLDTGQNVANLEMFRPRHRGGPRDLDVAGAQIAGKNFYFPKGGIDPQNVASEEDRERMRAETAALLASQAARGDQRAAEALARLLGTAPEEDGAEEPERKIAHRGK